MREIDVDTKHKLVNTGIVVGVIILAFGIIQFQSKYFAQPDEEVVKCIGEKAVLYVQEGCSHCRTQELKFGKSKEFLNIVDCFYEVDKCQEISATPTWIINGEIYAGVFSVEELKNMTGCESSVKVEVEE